MFFFAIVFIFFFTIKLRYRKIVLLASSLMFLSSFSPVFLLYAVLFGLINYYAGIGIACLTGRPRKLIYFSGQIFNIGGLLLFKYIDFFIENSNLIVFSHWNYEMPHLSLIIPLGISYYTFQGISYLYLIHKAKDTPESSLIIFFIYMLFWPKVLAGPIERHRSFLPQLRVDISFDAKRVKEGARMFMWGILKKVVVGDTFGFIIGQIYSDVDGFQGGPLVFALLLQPMQLYCDFSGYTDMAIGVSKIFGINLTDNFKQPFFSKSLGEFWRCWHISLSSWCNDFFYNRLLLKYRRFGNVAATYAIFVTFLMIGIWHGDKFTFIILGVIQAIVINLEFYLKVFKKKYNLKNRLLPAWIKYIWIYFVFSASLVFFFSNNVADSLLFFNNLFKDLNNFQIAGFDINDVDFFIAFLLCFLVLYIDYCKINNKKKILGALRRRGIIFQYFSYLFLIGLVIYFGKYKMAFVYMGF